MANSVGKCVFKINLKAVAQLAYTSSKSAMETADLCVKSVLR